MTEKQELHDTHLLVSKIKKGLKLQATLDFHARSMCAHIEAMGMQAENEYSGVYYIEKDFNACLKKWGLVDENGAPVK